MEKLTVRNFLNIKEADIEIKKFNVIIGYEKNILSELIYFFRVALGRAQLHSNPKKAITKLFNLHFPRHLWKDQKFTINYKIKDIEIRLHHNSKFQTTINESFKNKLESSQDIKTEGIVFIPTGKSVFASSLLTAKNKLFIIEDPEKHLIPKIQKEFISSISKVCNTFNNLALIATNSPYILSAINILLLANNVINKSNKDEIRNKIEELIDKDTALKFENITAYEVGEDGITRSFLNYENKLLGENIIDKATEELENLFDKIIEIELCKNL
jgi:predicted ATPase